MRHKACNMVRATRVPTKTKINWVATKSEISFGKLVLGRQMSEKRVTRKTAVPMILKFITPKRTEGTNIADIRKVYRSACNESYF